MPEYRRIRDLREDHDLTQRDLANELGLTQPQYWRYENGFRDIPTQMLLKLAEKYDVTTDYILGRDEKK